MAHDPIPLLILNPMDAARTARIAAGGFRLIPAGTPEARAAAIREHAGVLRAVLTNGTLGFTAAEIAALPRLEIICTMGAGHENVDVAAARARGIVVTHGPGTNMESVADHTLALILALLRGIPQADAAVKRGAWRMARGPRPSVSGKRLGILGLGQIGLEIARRAEGGFGMPVGYHNRRPREGVTAAYFASPEALAAWSDVLVIATPGGAGTRHLVDAGVLAALGPAGFLVNIVRGSVVDQAALIAALAAQTIAGAALDVIDGEPDVPADLLALSNVIITPHIAGLSPEAMQATAALVLQNLQAHFGGRPVLTPVA